MTDAAARAGQSDQYLVADRLDRRARSLRVQAYAVLAIIVLVLIAGAIAFVFANKITSFGFPSTTAKAQYDAAVAAQNDIQKKMTDVQKEMSNIQDTTPVAKPFGDQIASVKGQITTLEEAELASCDGLTFTEKRQDIDVKYVPTGATPAANRLGEWYITLPLRAAFFSSNQAASVCGTKFLPHAQEITTFFRRIQDLEQQRNQAITEFNSKTATEVAPYVQKYGELDSENRALLPVLAETSRRAAEERVLGAPLGEERAQSSVTDATDWPQIIQSNLTRLSSLAIMFFLVAVLVPQYRYSIRMAAFYDARADSIRLAGRLQPITQLDELEKTILAMTPNIDFGKAPTTPIDQLVELIKAAKN
jgi:phage host-nuclease inhibitor protein Gam